ncbi:sensor histidine kinase [Paenibacillus faecalis]|uniref:sensor histidine kinase n=1 Tax=Paenibacillus faecalis TaxID=2079532 RepID=UPI000D0F7AA4|nr:HAMP domain-containing sensor histidine kinase [Paenibacillus faecalis]
MMGRKRKKSKREKGRFRNSLTSRYLLIILIAMIFMPIIFPLGTIFYWIVQGAMFNMEKVTPGKYTNGTLLETMWHEQAAKLDGQSPQQINEQLRGIWNEYPETSIFWVDASSQTRLKIPDDQKIPEHWSADYTAQFMKNSLNADPFTTVALIGDTKNGGQGFMVMQLPRKYFSYHDQKAQNGYIYLLFFIITSIMFIVISWLFFVRIRKRLLHLRDAMTSPGETGIPAPIPIRKPDEIGQLEEAYNHMVDQLKKGRQREMEEEQLRKSLIANLSHDLRTPLTVIRSHIFSMGNEPLSVSGKESLELIESKIGDLGALIDNLLSYNLLTSGRVQLNPKPHDILRLVRESAAGWYPMWEKEGIEADIDLQEEPLVWLIDALWFKRILDNLFQNVVRHAKSGQYIGIYTKELPGKGTALIVSDKGPGMDGASADKGAGIGLAVVDYLTQQMEIDVQIHSSDKGTSFILSRKI